MTTGINPILTHLSNVYLGNRFFYALGGVVLLSALGFRYAALFFMAVIGAALLLLGTIYDLYRLYRSASRISADRTPPSVLSLGDELPVTITLGNASTTDLRAVVTDELPEQLQVRDQRISVLLPAATRQTVSYPVRPATRGVYRFGDLNVFLQTAWRLAERRLVAPQVREIAVYPSIVGMQHFRLEARANVPHGGKSQPRPVTRSYEFDQIKTYVRGDDLRNVNWKATGRRGQVMVNQYETERAQRIYSIIDKGRTMLMPFAGLSLLDHAINASLALSRVILDGQDRAGLLTFSDKLGDVIPADNKPDQLARILQLLYRQREREGESDYDLLYYATRRVLPGRSLLLLFTNFESNYALDRVLPTLKRIAKNHSLVVILFENTEVAALLQEKTVDIGSVYLKSTARRYVQERQLMALRLRRNGIRVVLTPPEGLSGAAIQEYLRIKRKGF
ncbi:DUF58 domain-containing protein [Neolewinella xylanilytica]|uniref:DUF58 domain-containing protein n=1 Tax=Neolewinella xylanilytica TaxID=1514080 RepID=UPI000CEAFC90|nr:DUF58 domain-containing protein [Neolewinella xylanilytica]